MLLITSLWSLLVLTWLMTVTSVMMSGMFDLVNFGLCYTVFYVHPSVLYVNDISDVGNDTKIPSKHIQNTIYYYFMK